jgi:1-aminocyclopropane-1-carboxylate deaminase/D-cysteine desulfhydrase-like pyridoxal-dependent ACC family enzyme
MNRSVCQIKKIYLSDWPAGPEVWMLREDLSHPFAGGNKWWKLKNNIERALQLPKPKLITMGGAYSNHIYAVAGLCHELNLPCEAFIRGEESENLSPTLRFAREKGMKLRFVTREEYRSIRTAGYEAEEAWFMPEGGSNKEGVMGCKEWAGHLPKNFDLVALACGSGGSLAGLAAGSIQQAFLGFSVLKGNFMKQQVSDLQLEAFGRETENWRINTDFHGGGYAKLSPELWDFMARFTEQTGIPLEPIYTAKMMFGIDQMIRSGELAGYQKILTIHTGGLQALEGLRQRVFFRIVTELKQIRI